MQARILLAFNHYTFNHSTQILLSLLDPAALHCLLRAVERVLMHRPLAHLIRARLVVLGMHRLDRSLYFIHFESVPAQEFDAQRCNLVAVSCDDRTLNDTLTEIEAIKEKGESLFGEEYSVVQGAVDQPDLPLPPIRRDTVAPHCQTVYQVVLACQKINYQGENVSVLTNNNEDAILNYFFQLLSLKIKQTALYLCSLRDPLQHFAEITYRFMVYRNTVLALHAICPFQRLSTTMQLWKNALISHYQRANQIFLSIAGFRVADEEEYGRFTKDMLREEGYLNDYAEGVIDLSVDEDIVAFCGHSKTTFGPLYSHLEELIVSSIKDRWELLPQPQQMEELVREWRDVGLRPSTIRKIVQQLDVDCSIMRDSRYCRQDDFIQTCARIHGLLEHSSIAMECS